MDGVDEADGVKNDVFNDVDDGSNDTDEVKATEVDKIVVTDEVINDRSGKADSATEEGVEGCDTAELTVASYVTVPLAFKRTHPVNDDTLQVTTRRMILPDRA